MAEESWTEYRVILKKKMLSTSVNKDLAEC